MESAAEHRVTSHGEVTPTVGVFPPPHPELRRLAPLVGSWHAADHTRAGVFGPSVPVITIETFRWLEGGHFLVSTYDTRFGCEPRQKGVMYWGYDADADRFRNLFFSNNGPFTEDGNRYEGVVADGTLTFTGPARFRFPLDGDGDVRVEPDGTIRAKWWLRDGAGAWRRWMDTTYVRCPW